MQIKRETLSPTKIKLSIVADTAALDSIKQIVLARLSSDVKLAGFRAGKAPVNLVEKQLDPAVVQNEFLNEALNQLYAQAVNSEKLKVVKEPEVTITKFVPYSTLEFTAEVEAVGKVKLGDYKKVKLPIKKVEVTANEVNSVIENLRERAATKKTVTRAAKNGDEVNIDFKGVDAKTSELIEGAEGKDYPLIIGSKSFIPGFEEELVGLKTKEVKTFDITFPANYGVPALQNRKVKFEVSINEVNELQKPLANDEFAANAGPFKKLSELKADIKKQLQAEKESEAEQAYNNELLQKIADISEVALPDVLIEEEISRLEDEEKRNIAYRGQTWQEHLAEEGVSEQEHRERQKPLAETRVKIGLVLGEIAEQEAIKVTDAELEVRINLLKGQYQDATMQAELDKPENRRDIYSRLIIEKTIDRLREIAQSQTAKAQSV